MAAIVIDLRSDTVTKPTPAMRQAMANAEVGDDVYREDPTILALEEKCAKLLGKENALFVPSGTMANLICNMCHCQERGLEIIIGHQSHIALYEQGNIAQIAGVFPRIIPNLSDGTFDMTVLANTISPGTDVHHCKTTVICLENTHNRCGGKILPLDFLEKVYNLAQEKDLKVHFDGARLLNASVGLGVPVSSLTRFCDSVSICFSKGIGAPVGSVVAGSASFIARALRCRKVLGGGMRQAGVLAAAALVGLDNATETMLKDHHHAKKIANGMKEIPSTIAEVNIEEVHSNMIFIKIMKEGLSASDIVSRLKTTTPAEEKELGKEVILKCGSMDNYIRLVTNCDVSEEDIDIGIKKLCYVFNEICP